MVIEGWIHDSALEEAAARFHSGNYSRMVCTGVPIDVGSYLLEFKSYPEMTAERLKEIGFDPEKIIVSVGDDVKKDRTFTAALALRRTLDSGTIKENNLHLITTGPHGRRSLMLFKKALGPDYNIGVTCLEPASYEPESWYTCSEGVRYIINELIAYTYAKLLFRP
ncbi:ElyC/SanA/YdcF family protein [Pontiellaceae bacterium B12227]|nr:ElyC/SanA/YdcF family protein [Pontiellaceae bacterium B12227]